MGDDVIAGAKAYALQHASECRCRTVMGAVSVSAPACAAPPSERPYSYRLYDTNSASGRFAVATGGPSSACATNAYATEDGRDGAS
jgi:hypothetical protein